MNPINTLMSELTPYILTGFFALVGWYLRENQKQHSSLVEAVHDLNKTLSTLEQKLEEKIDAHVKRFDRFVLNQEGRLTTLETRCSYEHGRSPDRRIDLQRVPSWQIDSNIENGGTQTK